MTRDGMPPGCIPPPVTHAPYRERIHMKDGTIGDKQPEDSGPDRGRGSAPPAPVAGPEPEKGRGVDERGVGLLRKYDVRRLNDPIGKHADCTYFVLDLKHDKFAAPAIAAYAVACRDEYPVLAAELDPAPSPPTAEEGKCKWEHPGRWRCATHDGIPSDICDKAPERAALLACREAGQKLYAAVLSSWPTQGIEKAMQDVQLAEAQADKVVGK